MEDELEECNRRELNNLVNFGGEDEEVARGKFLEQYLQISMIIDAIIVYIHR